MLGAIASRLELEAIASDSAEDLFSADVTLVVCRGYPLVCHLLPLVEGNIYYNQRR